MDLLDRYLAAVKKHLPWQRQDDIIAELRANLESQLEDKESELGWPLTAGEVGAILKRMGPPMQVAARYQTQQYLIGPGLFPTYWYVMRLAFGWGLTIYLIVAGVQILVGPPSTTAIVETVLRVPGLLITVAAWVTLVFAAMEFGVRRWPEKCPAVLGVSADWSPSTLPPVEAIAAGAKKRRSYAQAVAEVVFGFLALVWVLLIPSHPYLLFGPGWLYLRELPYQPAPAWTQFYWWIIALNIIQLTWRTTDLLWGRWQRPAAVQSIVVKAFGLIPLAMLLTAKDHMLATLKNPALDQARYGATLESINQGVYKAFVIIAVIAVLGLAWDIWHLGREAMRKRAAAR
jgi:hypothetical protein